MTVSQPELIPNFLIWSDDHCSKQLRFRVIYQQEIRNTDAIILFSFASEEMEIVRGADPLKVTSLLFSLLCFKILLCKSCLVSRTLSLALSNHWKDTIIQKAFEPVCSLPLINVNSLGSNIIYLLGDDTV